MTAEETPSEGTPSGEEQSSSEEAAVTAWRLTSRAYQTSAFDGEGARLYGGRWNSAGTPMTYLAGSLALAALEQLVHLSRAALLEGQFVRFRVRVPAPLVLVLDPAALPGEGVSWTRALEATREIGDGWAEEKDSAVLEVPSAVVPEESNYLLNPLHPKADEIAVSDPTSFVFDERLLGGEPSQKDERS